MGRNTLKATEHFMRGSLYSLGCILSPVHVIPMGRVYINLFVLVYGLPGRDNIVNLVIRVKIQR